MRDIIDAPRPVWTVVRVATLVAAGLISSPGVRAVEPAGQDFGEILSTLGRLSELYADSALSFTCVERITQTRFRSLDRIDTRASHTFDYFYVFNTVEDVAASDGQLRVGLRDYRTKPGVAADGEADHVNPADLGLAHLSRAYSWIFIFGEEVRSSVIFIQESDDTVMGREAHVIGFEPKLPIRIGANDWSGRAWVDKETLQLLRVEAVTSAEYLEQSRRRAANRTVGGRDRSMNGDLYGFTHAEVEFGIEKNGLRFPSRAMLTGTLVRLEEDDYDSYRAAVSEFVDRGIKMNRTFRVEQTYRDYRFFSVRTAIEVERHLRS